MGDDRGLVRRIADQFSYRGPGADVWRAFDRFLPTGEYLNIGYAPRFVPFVLGNPQRRLGLVVGRTVADGLGDTADVTLLDVGCGRGGPTLALASRFGFRAVGVDLVGYNVRRARENAAARGIDASFVVGDAARLPVADGAVGAATAIDAGVYLPDERAVFGELARVLAPGGVGAVADLVVADDAATAERRAVRAFAEAWDMAPIPAWSDYRAAVGSAGLDLVAVRDVTPNSTGRFGKWARWYLGLADAGVAGWLLRRWGLDAADIEHKVRTAHAALPALRHLVVTLRR